MKSSSSPDPWNAQLYQQQQNFVWQYGNDLLELLNPQPEQLILDLGCGTGQLTQAIAEKGAKVVGIDRSSRMVEQAKHNFPALDFRVEDARNFVLEELVDEVFSNAALHWVLESEMVVQNIYSILKPGGRFVVELGAVGNVEKIRTAIAEELHLQGKNYPEPWYFPSLGTYSNLLEQNGFWVNYAAQFERPTALQDGDRGLWNWLTMFTEDWLGDLSEIERNQLYPKVIETLKPSLYRENIWYADYCRLRIIATKI